MYIYVCMQDMKLAMLYASQWHHTTPNYLSPCFTFLISGAVQRPPTGRHRQNCPTARVDDLEQLRPLAGEKKYIHNPRQMKNESILMSSGSFVHHSPCFDKIICAKVLIHTYIYCNYMYIFTLNDIGTKSTVLFNTKNDI